MISGHCVCCGLPCNKESIFEPCCQWCSGGFYNELTGTCGVCRSDFTGYPTKSVPEVKEQTAGLPVVFVKNHNAAKRLLHAGMIVVPVEKHWHIQHDYMGKFSPLMHQHGYAVHCPSELMGQSMRKVQKFFLDNFQLMVSQCKDHWLYSDV